MLFIYEEIVYEKSELISHLWNDGVKGQRNDNQYPEFLINPILISYFLLHKLGGFFIENDVVGFRFVFHYGWEKIQFTGV